MKNDILAIFISGIVLFMWGFMSWAILPWHDMAANQFTNEAAVAQILRENSPTQGIYYLPFNEEEHRPGETAAFINVLPNGFDANMGEMMGSAIIGQWFAALLVLLLLKNTANLSYWQRVKFVALSGLAIGFISHFPYWNWFGFSSIYIFVIIMDTLIGWTLAGLVLAKFTSPTKSINA